MNDIPLTTPHGVIACGHPVTADAAADVLRSGGNAFDAIVAAYFTTCVAETVFASIGSGGYALVETTEGNSRVYDFFVQTPSQWTADDVDFFPIEADFGTTTQEFHIGTGAAAVPGAVRGVFELHRDLGSIPMRELMAPAIHAAQQGVEITPLQASLFKILTPIYLNTPRMRALFEDPDQPGETFKAGHVIVQSDLANTLEALANEDDGLFYEGELGRLIVDFCQSRGGHIRVDDLKNYQVKKLDPIIAHYRNAELLAPPPSSSGGLLIAFACELLQSIPNIPDINSAEHLALLAHAMDVTNLARHEVHLDEEQHPNVERILDSEFVTRYQKEIQGRASCLRGTTHMSVADTAGNIASMTVSNGEGCGYLVPDTGIILNNMLGEEDINPTGFFNAPNNQRMTSMMSPTIVNFDNGRRVAMGSGGSNRIRTAILQVINRLVDYDMSLSDAINAPRIHFERGLLSVEPGFDQQVTDQLQQQFENCQLWDQQNLYFGGVHAVMTNNGQLSGAADPRRGGVSLVV
ncbi:MAG: gamma-glutamyltransferase [Gammaproteobacteria bacterium]|nr:gamma-glutamyltransferase [Gammaproteobacteria bacterium]